MSDQRLRDNPLTATGSIAATATGAKSIPARDVIERRHTVSLWLYLLAALAFLFGCYLLFLEDGSQTRLTLPSLSPRTELPGVETPKVARIDTRSTPVFTATAAAASARAFSTEFLDSVWHDAEFVGVRRATFDQAFQVNVAPDPEVEAKWVAQPRTVSIPNILNEVETQKSLGYAVFTLHGKEYSLEPVLEGKELFYIFKDLTAGKETYPAGRFLYSQLPVNGKVLLDFNKAYTPPCAFTPYATCPLPPKQNRLQIRIEAGELNYGHH